MGMRNENKILLDFDSIQKIYEHMGDEESKKLFKLRIQYSLFEGKKEKSDIVQTTEEAKALIDMVSRQNGEFVLFGSGLGARYLMDLLDTVCWKCIVDNYPQKSEVLNIPIIRYSDFIFSKEDIIVISSWKYNNEMKAQLIKDGVAPDRIIEAGKLMNELMSRQYFDLPAMMPQKHEVFLDVGCYDGISSYYFSKWNKSPCAKIYAFEPDKNNIKKCKNNLDKTGLTYTLIPKGVWSKKTELRFCSMNTVASMIDECGESIIETVDLDSLFLQEKVTFIKMDIEGAEKEALLGAKNIIQKYHPKLAISIYHKKNDIFEIPHLILSYCNNYKFYLRHYSFGENDTILYAI